jgi:aspartate kinase
VSRPAAALTVFKIGGSVLSGAHAYRHAAAFLRAAVRESDAGILVVVSAELGHTDALLAEAHSVSALPDADALDLLWSTGELRSVALLTLALRAAGLAAAGLNVHETGVRSTGECLELNALALRAALASHQVVVVPGFLATRNQRLVTLGRGGSDLSAVRLAAWLRAARCVLLKDVDGYFTADPARDASAQPLVTLTFTDAIRMARAGCPLVQMQALIAAKRAAVPLTVRSMTGAGTTIF